MYSSCSSAIVLRGRAGSWGTGTSRAWGYPVLPLIFIVATVAIVINQLVTEPVESVTGLLIVLAGLPVYYLRVSKRASTQPVTNADR